MDFNEGMDYLSKLFKGKEWFYDVGTDQYDRYVVYIRFANHETIYDIPDEVAGRQVVVHFAGSLTANRDNFTNNLSSTTHKWSDIKSKLPPERQAKVDTAVKETLSMMELEGAARRADADRMDIVEEVVGEEGDEQSMRHLQNELERLEKVCGSFTLQDIFYEVQDGKNAVTNMSSRYPEVRQSLDKLFVEYGFDIIYEELDG